MKRLFIISALLSVAAITWSQDNEFTKKNSIGLNTSGLVNYTFKMEYEHYFKNRNSLQIAGGVILKQDASENVSGMTCEIQYRLNAVTPIYDGHAVFYFAPYGGYTAVDYSKETSGSYYDYSINKQVNITGQYKNMFNTISAGCVAGVKLLFNDKMFLDFNLGGGLKYAQDFNAKDFAELGTLKLGYSGIYPRMNLSIGYAF